MSRLALVCLAASAAGAQSQEQLSPELLLLARIKVHMSETLVRQPNYTCVETIERSRRGPGLRKFEFIDVIRLEVALVEGKEMFSYPGARRFEDKDLRELVPAGAIGNGNFALHARNIFESAVPQYTFRGDSDLNGQKTVRWDFRVPQMLSGYRLKVGDRGAIVGYHGSFWADPKTLDVRRLELVADDIPPELALSDARDRIDYARMKIGESDFLLPAGGEMAMTDTGGAEHRNRITFTACRRYAGESVLSFAEPPHDGPVPEAPQIAEVRIPADMILTLVMVDEIDSDRSAVGDPVRAKLDNNVKHRGEVLMPKGALVLGRVSRLERHNGFVMVGVHFTEIESPGRRAPFKASLSQLPPYARRMRIYGPGARPGEALLPMVGKSVRLGKGFIMYWRTEL